jgi:hypothetical protein
MGPLINPYLEVLLLFIAPVTIASSSHGGRQRQALGKRGGGTKKKKKKGKNKAEKREVWSTTVIEYDKSTTKVEWTGERCRLFQMGTGGD